MPHPSTFCQVTNRIDLCLLSETIPVLEWPWNISRFNVWKTCMLWLVAAVYILLDETTSRPSVKSRPSWAWSEGQSLCKRWEFFFFLADWHPSQLDMLSLAICERNDPFSLSFSSWCPCNRSLIDCMNVWALAATKILSGLHVNWMRIMPIFTR